MNALHRRWYQFSLRTMFVEGEKGIFYFIDKSKMLHPSDKTVGLRYDDTLFATLQRQRRRDHDESYFKGENAKSPGPGKDHIQG